MPTIIPKLSRSRESCRSSLSVTASIRPNIASRLQPPPVAHRAGSPSRRRTRPRGSRARSSTCASTPAASSRPRTRAAASAVCGSSSACSRVPSCAMLFTDGVLLQRLARAATSSRLDLDDDGRDAGHQLLRRTLRHQPAAIEDRETVAALGLVHVMGRHQDRRAATDQHEQALPEIAAAPADRRRSSARRAAAAPDDAASPRRARAAGAVRRSSCRRAAAAGDSRSNSAASSAMRASRAAPASPKIRAMNLQILVHGQVVPEREPLRHVAELGAHLLGIARHLVAEHAHAAGRGLEQPAEHPDRRRLARAVRAQEAVDAARAGSSDRRGRPRRACRSAA